jgi:hypothetical protein
MLEVLLGRQSEDLPVLSSIGKIVLDDGPNKAGRGGLVSVVDEPFGIADESNGPERRAVSLGPTPGACELAKIDHELGLA